MTPFASFELWNDSRTHQRCRLTVSDEGYEVEIQVDGERMIAARYPDIAEALSVARERQPPHGIDGPMLAA